MIELAITISKYTTPVFLFALLAGGYFLFRKYEEKPILIFEGGVLLALSGHIILLTSSSLYPPEWNQYPESRQDNSLLQGVPQDPTEYESRT